MSAPTTSITITNTMRGAYMHRSTIIRSLAAVAAGSLASAGLATVASADDAIATVSLGTTSVLTLPDSDGIRDTTSLNVTSDVATSVSLAVWSADRTTLIEDLAPVELTTDLLSTDVVIPVTGLTAGTFVVVATPAVGDAVTASLTVGSGEPSAVSAALSATTIFTWSKATPRSFTVTVTAKDETGLPVPFTGSVKTVVGSKTVTSSVKSTTGAAAKTTSVSVTKLVAGTGKVTATVSALKAGSKKYTSTAKTLKVLTTAVKSVKLSANYTTVYPAKDSYRDTTKITLTPTTTTGKNFTSTGSVKITYKGKTVKSWKITSSKARTFTWDGKYKGKIVPGTYTVTASIKGPQGSTKTTKSTIKVNSGKLKTKTKTVKYKANAVITTYEAYDYYYDGACYKNYYKSGDILCDGYDAYDLDSISLIATGKVTVPSVVVSAEKYGSASVKLTTHVTSLYGGAAWSYDTSPYGTTKIGSVQTGSHNLGSLKLPKTSKSVYLTLGLGEYATVSADTITATYTYKVMTH